MIESHLESCELLRRMAGSDPLLEETLRSGLPVTALHWTDPSHRSLGHLVPDIAVTRGRRVWVIDADCSGRDPIATSGSKGQRRTSTLRRVLSESIVLPALDNRTSSDNGRPAGCPC